MNIIDLFCGAGGFSKGFLDENFSIILGIDNDFSKLKTYFKNIRPKHCITNKKAFQNDSFTDKIKEKIKMKNDLTTLTKTNIMKAIKNKQIDVIIGSPPCKDFSSANFNKKIIPDRYNMVNEFIRITSLLNPTWFVIENVPGFFTSLIGETIETKMKILGYSTIILNLNASEFGIPQKRKRCFLLGCNNPKIDLSTINIINYKSKTKVSSKDALSDLEITENNENIIPYPFHIKSDYQSIMREKQVIVDNIPVIYNHITTKHSEKTLKKIYKRKSKPKFKKYSDLSGTITCFSNNATKIGDNLHPSPKLNRTYSLRECARIQSFPDNFIFYGNKKEIMTQIGDAVPPMLSRVIAKIIKDLSY